MKQISIVVRRKNNTNEMEIISSIKEFLMTKFGIVDGEIDFHLKNIQDLNRLKKGEGYHENEYTR